MIAPVGAMMELQRQRTLIEELNDALVEAEARRKEEQLKRKSKPTTP